ncbi:heparin cofactor 2 [Globicephala melas]|uniref:heparin cofactor 2 n=1 Tax=Globicephala melas TaxID=9731 RepID=UPI00122F7227|nr:heparin cofactor 2 [Globicephala melas]
MQHLLHSLVVSLLLASVCGKLGPRGQLDSGGGDPESVDPRWGQLKSGNLSRPLLPADFHKENTVTNEWIVDGEEDEDYLDLEKIFGEDDDYIDVVDAVSPVDPGTGAGSVLQLFPGKSRIQRLNLLNAKFALDLYRALKERVGASDNVFLAPIGVSTAMAMLSLGLRGDTHEQVHAALRFTDFINASTTYELGTVHNLFRKLTHRLFRRNFGYTLRSVSDLYIQKQVQVLDDFRAKVRQYYFAEVRAADFSDPAFISQTNQHISRLTKGLIRDVLEDVDPATQMMLLNCIYFKGSWVNKFPAEMTHNHNFRLNEREVVKVPMMQTKGSFLAASDQELDCDVLRLEYMGGISMLVVVPHKLSGMKTLEAQLKPQVVERWQKSMTNRTREVLLPKFKLEKDYNLVEALRSLGVTALFDRNSNMTGISDQRIVIDLFKHQGTIMVDEEGTQAAAVTTVGFMPLSTQVRFSVDRPFLFLVYEHRTGCLLFLGRVANPTRS